MTRFAPLGSARTGTRTLKSGAVGPGATAAPGFRVGGSSWPAPLSLTCTMRP